VRAIDGEAAGPVEHDHRLTGAGFQVADAESVRIHVPLGKRDPWVCLSL
jgi:hypothetical protein